MLPPPPPSCATSLGGNASPHTPLSVLLPKKIFKKAQKKSTQKKAQKKAKSTKKSSSSLWVHISIFYTKVL